MINCVFGYKISSLSKHLQITSPQFIILFQFRGKTTSFSMEEKAEQKSQNNSWMYETKYLLLILKNRKRKNSKYLLLYMYLLDLLLHVYEYLNVCAQIL